MDCVLAACRFRIHSSFLLLISFSDGENIIWTIENIIAFSKEIIFLLKKKDKIMYPDLSYLMHDILGTPHDNKFSAIKTFGTILVFSIIFSFYLIRKALRSKEQLGVFKGQKVRRKNILEISTSSLISNFIKIFLRARIKFFVAFVLVAVNLVVKPKSENLITISNKSKPAIKWIPLTVKERLFTFPLFCLFGILLGGIIFKKSSIVSLITSPVYCYQCNLLGLFFIALLIYFKYKKIWFYKNIPPRSDIITVYPHERLLDISRICIIWGFIGSKLLILIEDLDLVFDGSKSIDELLIAVFTGSGNSYLGGLLFASIFFIRYLRRKRIPIQLFVDTIAPLLMITYGIVKLGCHLSGCGDWGIINESVQPDWWMLPDWLWAYDYPQNVIREGYPIEGCRSNYFTRLDKPVFPTSAYLGIAFISMGFVLHKLNKRNTIIGLVFFLCLFFTGIIWYFVGELNIYETYVVYGFNLTENRLSSYIVFFIGLIGTLYCLWKYKFNLLR